MKKTFPAIILFSLFFIVTWLFYNQSKPAPKDFTTCVGAGYAVLETDPRQCLADNGQIFKEDLSKFEKQIKTNSPSASSTKNTTLPNQTNSSSTLPLSVKGKVKDPTSSVKSLEQNR